MKSWGKSLWHVRILLGLLAGALIGGVSSSCNSEVKGPEFTRPETGTLYTFIGDTPICDVLAFRSNITGMKLRDATNSEVRTIFPTTTTYVSVKLDFAGLRDFSTIMNIASAQVAGYDQVQLTLSSPQIVVYDPANDPPVKTIGAHLTTGTPTATLAQGLSVSNEQLNVLRLDFDMLKSIELGPQGQITGKVRPFLTATAGTSTDPDGFGFFDNLVGFVMTVSPNASGDFIGSFALQLLSGSGPALPVNLTSKTDMHGVADLKSLETGRVVEVGAYVDEKGNVVARNIEVEDRAVVEERRIAFIGNVFPTPTRDANGNVTQFSFYVRAEEPNRSGDVPLDSVVTVNVLPTTTFQVSSRLTNFANLPFDASSIAIGQELIVHGKYTVKSSLSTVVDASSIYLKVQTMQGGLSSLVKVGPDGKAGAFWLGTCSTLLQSVPILVLTNTETVFVNVFGLAEISPQATLLARGLPFYQLRDGTINGIPVPAGTLVFIARQIHQLQ